MQKKRILVKLIPILFILIIIWFFFFISKEIIEKPKDGISSYVPDNTEWIIDLNTSQIIDKGVQSVLFSKKPDYNLNALISGFNQQQLNKKVNFEEIGIRLNSNIYLFEIVNKNDSYICGLFNLDNPSLFINNTPKLLSSEFETFTNDNIGLVIYSQSIKKKKIAQTIFSNNNSEQNSTIYSFNFKTKNDSFSSNINTSILDSTILMNGSFSITTNSVSSNLSLKPNGFHLTSRIVPQFISDSICKSLEIESNRIIGISINHSSSELVSRPEVLINLNSSILLQFDSPLSIDSQLNIIAKKVTLMKLDSTGFLIGDQKYYTHQLNSSCVYIGKLPFNEDLVTTRDDILFVKGKPSNLVNIKGEGFVFRFLKIIPLFQASESLANSIESIQVRTTPNNIEEINRIEGDIKFRSGKKSMNELIRFVLMMNE